METAKSFSSVGGVPTPAIEAKELFPFTSPYAVYAGSCTSNNPNPKSEAGAPGAAAIAAITVPRGAAVPPPVPKIQVPALNLTVKTGSTPIVGAKVKITGTCSFERIYTTVDKGDRKRRALRPGPALGHLRSLRLGQHLRHQPSDQAKQRRRPEL